MMYMMYMEFLLPSAKCPCGNGIPLVSDGFSQAGAFQIREVSTQTTFNRKQQLALSGGHWHLALWKITGKVP